MSAQGDAEDLPWPDDDFDAALSCLVVAFMKDADAGAREMARVTKPGGTVASCMWDLAGGGMTMLKIFWTAYAEVKPGSKRAERRMGTRPGDIAGLLERAGLSDIVDDSLTVAADYTDFDDFWIPFTLGVGPAGSYARRNEPGGSGEREGQVPGCRARRCLLTRGDRLVRSRHGPGLTRPGPAGRRGRRERRRQSARSK